MALMRFDPFQETRAMRRLMDRFFERGWPDVGEGESMLPLDISEKDGEIIVRAALPGYRREDIDLDFEGGMLTIRATRTDDREEQGERFYRRERYYGAVSRTVDLPGNVDRERVSAEFKDGELTIHAPIVEGEQKRRIEIQG